jgi:hypothetical protein
MPVRNSFMGDAVLAYFSHEDGAAASCVAAFDAARLALARLAAVSNADCDLSAASRFPWQSELRKYAQAIGSTLPSSVET